MTVRWLNPILATASWDERLAAGADVMVDVRLLRDTSGNPLDLVAAKIAEIEGHVRAGHRTLVCCDHGLSRSIALAAAALSKVDGTGFRPTLEHVLKITGTRSVKVDFLADVRAALGEIESQDPRRDGQRVLVSGAHDFAGRAVLEEFNRSGSTTAIPLEAGAAPAILDGLVRSHRADCLVFLSVPPVPDSNYGFGEFLSELRGTLEVCHLLGLRFVFLSGHQVFSGYRGTQLRAAEHLPPRPAGAVGEALFLGERLIEMFDGRGHVESLVVRSSTLYGAGDRRPGFLRTFMEQAIRGEIITTHRYRDGSPIVDLLHVRDLAAGVVLAVRKCMTGSLHLGSDRGITTAELADDIVRLAGSHTPAGSLELPGEATNVILDCSRARIDLGWIANVDLESGLSETIAELRSIRIRNGVN